MRSPILASFVDGEDFDLKLDTQLKDGYDAHTMKRLT